MTFVYEENQKRKKDETIVIGAQSLTRALETQIATDRVI